jgi:hypothetical protein
MAPLGALSLAWVSAEASLSLGWRLMALVRDADSNNDWLATAAGPLDGQTPYIAAPANPTRLSAGQPTSCGASAGPSRVRRRLLQRTEATPTDDTAPYRDSCVELVIGGRWRTFRSGFVNCRLWVGLPPSAPRFGSRSQ